MPHNRAGSLALCVVAVIFYGCVAEQGSDLQEEVFARLGAARAEHADRVVSRLQSLWDQAVRAETDPVLSEAFTALHQSSQRTPFPAPDPALVASLEERYVLEYGDFYDILFVDHEGLIFHTVKMESDFGRSLFEPPLAATRLATALRGEPATRFVDYEIYTPSGEAASFFVVPVGDPAGGDADSGWMVFQLAVNSLNAILSDGRLGATGEVYITTAEGLMITRSRFVPRDQALSIVVDTDALRAALSRSSGEIVTEDYRGVKVLSSFQTLVFEGSTWVVFAEMDEDEVVSERFSARAGDYLPRLLQGVGAGEATLPSRPDSLDPTTRVDVNEYRRGEGSSTLATFGVSTCTGVIISYPGRFTYLGHVPPTDLAYGTGGIGALGAALTELETGDLLGDMMDRIKRYDVYPSELGALRITLVAVHTKGFANLVRGLLSEGVFLSQITILHDPTGKYANIYSSIADGQTVVEWRGAEALASRWTTPGATRSLGSLMSDVIY